MSKWTPEMKNYVKNNYHKATSIKALLAMVILNKHLNEKKEITTALFTLAIRSKK